VTALLLIHAAATWFMVGVIWFVQVAHYPLFAVVSGDAAVPYAYEHQRRTGWVIAPVMMIEMAAAVLVLLFRPVGVNLPLALVGLILLAVVWISTFALQIPILAKLLVGFDAALHRRLMRTNWIRTVAWTARGAIAWRMLC
jgi:hypothetical protein